jgi:preprotein translocase subunit SecG
MFEDGELRYWVRAFIVAVVAAIAVIDLILLQRYGPNGTISVIVREAARDFPILPYLVAFGMGALLYHITFK